MSSLRDTKFVKIIAEGLNIDQITDDACKLILNEVEHNLRILIHA